jgi:hypothetical protein
MLRQRTPREIAISTIGLGGCFSPEMWRALELLAAERSPIDKRKVSSGRLSGRPLYQTKPAISPDGTFATWPVELTSSVLGSKADSQSTSRKRRE